MKNIFLLILCSTIVTTQCMENESTETAIDNSAVLYDLAEQTKDAATKLLSISREALQAVPKEYYIKGACGLAGFMGCRFAYHRFQQTQLGSWLTGSRNLEVENDAQDRRLNTLEDRTRNTEAKNIELETRLKISNHQNSYLQRQLGGLNGRQTRVEGQVDELQKQIGADGARKEMAKLMQDFGRDAEERGQLLGRVERLENDIQNRSNLISFTMAGRGDGITMPQSRQITEQPTVENANET